MTALPVIDVSGLVADGPTTAGVHLLARFRESMPSLDAGGA